MDSDNRKYQQAKKQVEEEKGFYVHLFTYILVNVFLVILNLLTSDHYWFYWPMIGWGIGLFFHWIGVFGKNKFFGKQWEERRIQDLMDKDNS